MSAYRAHPAWAWDGTRWLNNPEIQWDEQGCITRIKEEAGSPEQPGILLPGLVNAHTHLEIGALTTAAGLGLPAWVRQLRAAGTFTAAFANTEAIIRAGTGFVVDVGNTSQARLAAQAARLPGQYFREIIGIDEESLPETSEPLCPHAPYSTHPARIRALARRGRSTIHLDEDPAERLFLRDKSGPWADYMRAIGRDLDSFAAPGCSPVAYLERLGALSPHLLLVHATLCDTEDIEILQRAKSIVALCPRSNLHITGCLPDVSALIAHQVPLVIGTDSLASTPDFDLLGEAAVLVKHFPHVSQDYWLTALTSGAEPLTGRIHRIAVGEAPGLLLVQASPETLFSDTLHRRKWLACPTL